ncbi:MAG: hypothetical protein AAGD06_31095 [Acidobacteriota bacterium]
MNHRFILRTFAGVVSTLLLAGAAAGDASANAEKVHSDWHRATLASGLDVESPIEFEPIAYADGVATYRLQSLETGEIAFADIRVPTNPLASDTAEAPAAEFSKDRIEDLQARGFCVPESTQCGVPTSLNNSPDASRCQVTLYRDGGFSGDQFITNRDWNTWRYVQWPLRNRGLNDAVSGITTTCAGAYFFHNKNWGGTSLFVPANTALGSLGGNNDRFSSMWHALP